MSGKGYGVITGASAGIGRCFAFALAKKGYPLVLVARRRERLEELARDLKMQFDTECRIICMDLSQEDAPVHLMTELKNLPVSICINNAGFGDCTPFLDGDLNKELEMIDVNVKAMHAIMKEMLRKLVAQKEGYLLNVASSAGLIPGGPYMATYYATKAYVTSITQAVAQELKEAGSPVYVGCLCPGPVDTEFNQVANVKHALKGLSAEECAEYSIKKMFRRKTVIVPTIPIKLLIVFGRFLPRKWFVALTGKQQKKKLH